MPWFEENSALLTANGRKVALVEELVQNGLNREKATEAVFLWYQDAVKQIIKEYSIAFRDSHFEAQAVKNNKPIEDFWIGVFYELLSEIEIKAAQAKI